MTDGTLGFPGVRTPRLRDCATFTGRPDLAPPKGSPLPRNPFVRAPSRFLQPALAVCLVVSGAAGLVYEIVWTRYLALFLGHTSYAVLLVLVAFMGGLARAACGWAGARTERPSRWSCTPGWSSR